MPPDSVMILLSFRFHSDRSLQHLLDVRGVRRLAEQPAAERHGAPQRLERVGRELLRHEADHRARGAIVRRRCRGRRPAPCLRVALTMPQMMLISVVLPAPFGPSSAKISPRRISRLMFFSALKAATRRSSRDSQTEMIGDIRPEAYRMAPR